MNPREFLGTILLLASLAPVMATAQTISTVAGNGGSGNTGDGGPAASAETGASTGVLALADGGLYIGGYNIVRHVAADGRIRTVAGNGSPGAPGDGGPATQASIQGNISGLALGPDGSLFIGEVFAVRKVSPAGIISTVVRHDIGVTALAFDPAGNLYIGGGCAVSRLSPGGSLSRFAGTGQCGSSAGDGGPATAATLGGNIYGLAVDATGSVWLADPDAHRIRKVGGDGVITSVAPEVWFPMGMSAASNGDIYVADLGNNVAFRITSAGESSVVAGTLYSGGFAGDGGPATAATLNMPWNVSVGSGRLLIADTRNNRIRAVTGTMQPLPTRPATTCASEGYTSTKLNWCRNICEMGYTGATLEMWVQRWINRYRDLPYCAGG